MYIKRTINATATVGRAVHCCRTIRVPLIGDTVIDTH